MNFLKAFQYLWGEGASEGDRFGSVSQVNFDHQGERKKEKEKWKLRNGKKKRNLPVWRLYGINIVEIDSYIYFYIRRDLLFPWWVRKNVICFTDVIWERGKELQLGSQRPLEQAVDSYPEIKIQKEIDLGLFAWIWGIMVIY